VLLVPEIARWREDLVTEFTLFPYGETDDQVDATTQYLDWILKNPSVPKRPPLALAAGTSSRGLHLVPNTVVKPAMQIPGGVLARRRIW
jgi:hypothetical protein